VSRWKSSASGTQFEGEQHSCVHYLMQARWLAEIREECSNSSRESWYGSAVVFLSDRPETSDEKEASRACPASAS